MRVDESAISAVNFNLTALYSSTCYNKGEGGYLTNQGVYIQLAIEQIVP